MKKKTMVIVSIVGIIIVLLALIGLTYAYFLTRIQGNINNKSISLTTADVSVEYYEGNGLVTLDKMMPGDKFTKTFNVKNTGTSEGEYAISLLNVENELEYFKDLTYVIKRNGTTIKEGIFPASDRKIVYKETISPSVNNECTKDNGCINEYELIVTYINRDYNQSIDMNKKVGALVQIENKEDVIEISNESQMKALSRITNSEFQTSKYTIDDDLQILNIEKINNSNDDTLNYILNSNYEFINDLSLTLNSKFGDDFFFGIGSMYNSFKGKFYGNNKKIILEGQGNYSFNANVRTLSLINRITDAMVSDLTVELNSNVLSDTNPVPLYMSVLAGISKNTKYENITININNSDFGIIHSKDKASTVRKDVKLGLLTSIIQHGGDIKNIIINLNNTNILAKTIENNLETEETYFTGLISSSITNLKNERINIENVSINMTNSNIDQYTTIKGYIGGMIGYASYVTINNANLNLIDSSIKIYSDNTTDLTGYSSLAAGGFIGFGDYGSQNTNDTIGDDGIIIKNSSFISQNSKNIDVISAKENKGGAVNVGGIMGIVFNNSTISNTKINVLNGNILAERSNENDNASTYGVHIGGIIGRMEHTGRINNCKVIGNNLNISATGSEKNNYIGGLVGVSVGPIHKDKISLEDNLVDGNNTTTIKGKIIEGNNEENLYMGALSGNAYYIIKNNTVKNLNIELMDITQKNTNIYLSNYIGKYSQTVNFINNTEYFTPATPEIINATIDNINVNLNFDEKLISVTRY